MAFTPRVAAVTAVLVVGVAQGGGTGSAESRAYTIAPPPLQNMATSRAVTVKYCVADVDGDEQVAVGDLLALLAEWNTPGTCSDLNGDGVVAIGDLLVLLAGWGPCS